MTRACARARQSRRSNVVRTTGMAQAFRRANSRSSTDVSDRAGPTVVVKRTEPKPTVVFDTYWKFAAERQAVYHRRVSGQHAPWTTDPILAAYKFTNAYRAADRVSQFLIQRIIYAEQFNALDTVFRVLLFKLFNKTETWCLLEDTQGFLVSSRFDVDSFDLVLNAASQSGASIYSAAYIMPSGPISIRRPRKHRMHLELLAALLRDGTLRRLALSTSMADAYQTLVALPGIGPFLAYQFATDLNYSDHFSFSEMEFVMPGPGARDGVRKCFETLGDYSEAETIRWVAERQEREFRVRGLRFQSLWGRPLQLIDCQNLFCEVDKYARVAHPEIVGYSGRTRIKQRFYAQPSLPQPWFPPKWGINEKIANQFRPDLSADRTFAAIGETLSLGVEH